MMFEVDSRIASSSILIQEDRLSNVYLKNTQAFPWLVLVPRIENVQEIFELSSAQQQLLMQEISDWSRCLKELFQPKKLNIGALGNIVSQLHLHIVARFEHDSLWPHSIWQAGLETIAYPPERLQSILEAFSSFKNQR
jgi:diadenosine tetraphosphate (Ap4A) HIT family hydrolase